MYFQNTDFTGEGKKPSTLVIYSQVHKYLDRDTIFVILPLCPIAKDLKQ